PCPIGPAGASLAERWPARRPAIRGSPLIETSVSSLSPQASASSSSPQAWCRDLLATVSGVKVHGPEAGAVEMLLTYFIQRNPTSAEFDGLLPQFVDSSRL